MKKSIIEVKGSKPGATLAIFAGIHGNEKAGVIALEQVVSEIKIEAGKAYFVFANPPAIKADVRFVKKNLNRLFLSTNKGRSWEDKRARELMQLLDSCDALLDLHGYNSPEDTPFVITGGPGLEVAKIFDVDKVVTGIDQIVPGGTDGYMLNCGKVGVCLECGSNLNPKKYVGMAKGSIRKFLSYYKLTSSRVETTRSSQQVLRVVKMVKKQTELFAFDKPYKNFDALEPNCVFATDGDTQYVAKENQFIIFPHENEKIGQDVFTIIRRG
ncbi:MAG: succinylglutamate desuccinylase/aspartoacylase family protein [Candidatus Berkelbacteria bacterium]|nr:succinylglutamate desuccinylase/aspartoacylase family protein [Candidatus Berkelbacteria bacterium]